eukprot:3729910-Prorocentrum_lima.AAC.1
MVGGHMLRTLCEYEWLFRDKWEAIHEGAHMAAWYQASISHTCLEATGGGLLEISAAFTAYHLQAV